MKRVADTEREMRDRCHAGCPFWDGIGENGCTKPWKIRCATDNAIMEMFETAKRAALAAGEG